MVLKHIVSDVIFSEKMSCFRSFTYIVGSVSVIAWIGGKADHCAVSGGVGLQVTTTRRTARRVASGRSLLQPIRASVASRRRSQDGAQRTGGCDKGWHRLPVENPNSVHGNVASGVCLRPFASSRALLYHTNLRRLFHPKTIGLLILLTCRSLLVTQVYCQTLDKRVSFIVITLLPVSRLRCGQVVFVLENKYLVWKIHEPYINRVSLPIYFLL